MIHYILFATVETTLTRIPTPAEQGATTARTKPHATIAGNCARKCCTVSAVQ